MSKRKPDQVITHRIELQSKERELVEMAIYADAIKELGPSIIAAATATGGAYLGAAWLHMVMPNVFPAPPLLPDAPENESTNAFVSYARNYVERRTDPENLGGTVGGYLNPFTSILDVLFAGYETYQEQNV